MISFPMMRRLLPFALAIFLAMLPVSARAELREESVPAQDLVAPAATQSPANDTDTNPDSNSNSEDWEPAHPAAQPPAQPEAPEQHEAPAAGPTRTAPAPVASPAEIAPAIDVGSIATVPQVSDSSLAPMIATAPTPARAASLRITEQERVELEQGHTDQAIRELAHAISIDPSNSYAYFYLGRAYVARRDYGQAQTFFRRAEIGLAANSAWLGECYAFEGQSMEEAGRSAEAATAYQKALAASPGNLTARVGITRLSAFLPASVTAPAAPTDLDQAAPQEADPPDAPDEDPAPPPPASPPPPSD
jgi:Flp pilus assembly protein TadD